jgi:RHS repeat-associated protein
MMMFLRIFPSRLVAVLLLCQGISSGQSLYDVVVSLSDRQRIFNQRKEISTLLTNQTNDPSADDLQPPDDLPIQWFEAGASPTEEGIQGLKIGAKITLLNQAVRVFDSLKFGFLNSSPGEFADESVVGALVPYKSGDFDPLPRATPENFNEVLSLLGQRVRCLRLVQWPAAFRSVEIGDRKEVYQSASLTPPASIGPDGLDAGEPSQSTSIASSFFAKVDVRGGFDEQVSEEDGTPISQHLDVSISSHYPESALVSATAPDAETMQIGGTVYILRRSFHHGVAITNSPPEFEKNEAGYLVVGSKSSGDITLMEDKPAPTFNGTWVTTYEAQGTIRKSFVEGGYQHKRAGLLPFGHPERTENHARSYERNWRIGCIFYSIFKPTFTRGVDAESARVKLELSDRASAASTADGEFRLHPRPSQLFGISVGPGLKGAGNGYISAGSLGAGFADGFTRGGVEWNWTNWDASYHGDDEGTLLRFDSTYAVNFAGSCSDYHVVYENNRTARVQSLPADSLGWPYPVSGSGSVYDPYTLYRAWDAPRLKQVVGRDLIADIVYNANHYGGYTVNIYRKPVPTEGTADPAPGVAVPTSGLEAIRTWAFSNPDAESEAHPATAEKLLVEGKAGETFEIQAGAPPANGGIGFGRGLGGSFWHYYGYDWCWWLEGSYSWTLNLKQGDAEKFKKVIEVTLMEDEEYDRYHHSIQRESRDGQEATSLSSTSLHPFDDFFPSDWQITAAGKTIIGSATFDSYGPDSAYGRFPTGVSIGFDGVQPDADYAWDTSGLLILAKQPPWHITGEVEEEDGAYKLTHRLNGEEGPITTTRWIELLDSGNTLKIHSAPDGNATGKLHPSVAWSQVEYGTASRGLPGLPHRVIHSDGTGATYGWNASPDGSYVLTLEEGLLSGSSVTRGTKMIRNVNSRGFPTQTESFVIHGGTVQTGGSVFPSADFTAWGMPKKATDFNTGLTSTWAYSGNLSRLSTHTNTLGLPTNITGYDVLGRPGTTTINGISAGYTYGTSEGKFTTTANITGAAGGTIVDTRDGLGRLLTSNSTWNTVQDNLTVTPGSSSTGIQRETLLGTYNSSVRSDGSVATASGPTMPFGGTADTGGVSVDGGLLKTLSKIAGQTASFQTTWSDAWGRIRKITAPTASGTGTTDFLYSDATSSLKRTRVTEPTGRKTITESDPYNSAGAITRSGIDVNGNGELGASDRYVESTTTVSGTKLVTTLKLTEDSGLREILSTEWNPDGNETVTKINRIGTSSNYEEKITHTPNYTTKTIKTESTKGWIKNESFNNLGLTTSSVLSGAGVPSATLTPVWRADGSLSEVTFTAGGDTHSATFKNNGTLDTLTAPGKGNILGGHTISGGVETLTVDGTTIAQTLDGTQTTTSGGDTIGKTETLAVNGSGFKETIHPATGSDTTLDYQSAGAPTSKNYAAGTGETYGYQDGLLHTVSLARGGDLTYGYSDDGAKDLTSAAWPQVTSGAFTIPSVVQTYGHDRAGRVDEIGDASGARTITWQNGRATGSACTAGPLAGYEVLNSRNAQGTGTGFTAKRGGVTLHSATQVPNGISGEISEITSGNVKIVIIRNAARQATGFQWGNASGTFVPTVTQNWTRGTAGRILSASSNVSGAPSFNYKGTANNEATAFDVKGRRLKCATAGGEWVYQYTDGRLTSAVHPTLGSFSYGFDGIGRRTDKGSANTSDLLNRTLTWTNSQNKTVKIAAHPAAQVWFNGTQIPNFTGSYNYPVPSPGASGGWVPWNTLAVLPGQGDAGANPDAKAEQSGAVWVPPVNEALTYDAAGNRQSSALWDYGWNAKNELVRARTKNHTSAAQGYDITNAYDAQSRRFSKKVNRYQNGSIVEQKVITFIHDGNDIIYEREQLPSGLTTCERKYVWGPDISGTHGGAGGAGGLLLIRETKGNVTTDLYPLYDGSGNVIALADSSGNLQAEYGYTPFGELLYARGPHAQSCPFRFATKYYDQETGLCNFGERFYDPVTCQFLSREPLGESESLNLYSYCGNDPVNNVDVLGLAKIELKTAPQIIPVPGLEGRFQVWFSVIEGGKSGDWEHIGFYPSSVLIGAATKLRLETDSAYRTRQGIQAMRSMGDQLLLAGELELLKIKEDTATLLPGGHAAVAISREQYGAAAAWIVGEGVVATVGGELLGRGLSYGGKAGYLMATGSTMAESRLILGLSKELATGALTSGTPLAAAPLYAPANFVSRTLAASDSGGTSFLETYAFSAAKQSNQTTVLGENMMQRVIPFATKTNARTLPFGTTSAQWSKMTFQQRWKLNDGALRARINDGDLFRYIGQDPFRNPLLRQEFDLTGSELLRLNDRRIPFQIVSPQEVMSVLGHP